MFLSEIRLTPYNNIHDLKGGVLSFLPPSPPPHPTHTRTSYIGIKTVKHAQS
jgi:hypothetical protein